MEFNEFIKIQVLVIHIRGSKSIARAILRFRLNNLSSQKYENFRFSLKIKIYDKNNFVRENFKLNLENFSKTYRNID